MEDSCPVFEVILSLKLPYVTKRHQFDGRAPRDSVCPPWSFFFCSSVGPKLWAREKPTPLWLQSQGSRVRRETVQLPRKDYQTDFILFDVGKIKRPIHEQKLLSHLSSQTPRKMTVLRMFSEEPAWHKECLLTRVWKGLLKKNWHTPS